MNEVSVPQSRPQVQAARRLASGVTASAPILTPHQSYSMTIEHQAQLIGLPLISLDLRRFVRRNTRLVTGWVGLPPHKYGIVPIIDGVRIRRVACESHDLL